MTRDAIPDLISGGEGATVEFKRSLARDVGGELCTRSPTREAGPSYLVSQNARKIVGVADHPHGRRASVGERVLHQNRPLQEGHRKASCYEPPGARDPDKSRSGKQRYRLTMAGRRIVTGLAVRKE